MNWDAVGAVAEVIGAVAVVVTLIYLAIQIRQNTNAVRLQTGHNISEEYRDIFAIISQNEGLADLIHRAALDHESISGADKARYYALNSNFVRAVENAFVQWNENALDHRHWSGMKRMLSDYTRLPAFQEYWANRKHWFSDEFQAFMDDEILATHEQSTAPLPGRYE